MVARRRQYRRLRRKRDRRTDPRTRRQTTRQPRPHRRRQPRPRRRLRQPSTTERLVAPPSYQVRPSPGHGSGSSRALSRLRSRATSTTRRIVQPDAVCLRVLSRLVLGPLAVAVLAGVVLARFGNSPRRRRRLPRLLRRARRRPSVGAPALAARAPAAAFAPESPLIGTHPRALGAALG
jgi:hypothetical protein